MHIYIDPTNENISEKADLHHILEKISYLKQNKLTSNFSSKKSTDQLFTYLFYYYTVFSFTSFVTSRGFLRRIASETLNPRKNVVHRPRDHAFQGELKDSEKWEAKLVPLDSRSHSTILLEIFLSLCYLQVFHSPWNLQQFFISNCPPSRASAYICIEIPVKGFAFRVFELNAVYEQDATVCCLLSSLMMFVVFVKITNLSSPMNAKDFSVNYLKQQQRWLT